MSFRYWVVLFIFLCPLIAFCQEPDIRDFPPLEAAIAWPIIEQGTFEGVVESSGPPPMTSREVEASLMDVETDFLATLAESGEELSADYREILDEFLEEQRGILEKLLLPTNSKKNFTVSLSGHQMRLESRIYEDDSSVSEETMTVIGPEGKKILTSNIRYSRPSAYIFLDDAKNAPEDAIYGNILGTIGTELAKASTLNLSSKDLEGDKVYWFEATDIKTDFFDIYRDGAVSFTRIGVRSQHGNRLSVYFSQVGETFRLINRYDDFREVPGWGWYPHEITLITQNGVFDKEVLQRIRSGALAPNTDEAIAAFAPQVENVKTITLSKVDIETPVEKDVFDFEIPVGTVVKVYTGDESSTYVQGDFSARDVVTGRKVDMAAGLELAEGTSQTKEEIAETPTREIVSDTPAKVEQKVEPHVVEPAKSKRNGMIFGLLAVSFVIGLGLVFKVFRKK
ncbi:MAG: hypothetical protein RLY93_14865 [Sumerlaeia bacterium]